MVKCEDGRHKKCSTRTVIDNRSYYILLQLQSIKCK